jgi:hypothetical protein
MKYSVKILNSFLWKEMFNFKIIKLQIFQSGQILMIFTIKKICLIRLLKLLMSSLKKMSTFKKITNIWKKKRLKL